MIWHLIIILILYVAVFLTGEFFYRRGMRTEYSRKIAHIGGGFVSLLLPVWFGVPMAVVIGIFFALFLLIIKRQKLLDSVHKINGHSSGAVLFPLGLTVTFVTFVPIKAIIFQGAVLILALADGLAGVIGYKFGQKKYNLTGEKTWLGSVLFFIVTLLVLLGVVWFVKGQLSALDFVFAIIAALLVSFLEGLFGKGLDNLVVPVSAGAAIYYLLYIV
ncbi:hypothetical protein HOB10_01575 [Candidatus Parcubacteria bacterium]|jgi:phytol kinase|nr:hypothetical protein [Candidatus Parcubacteria bacterium]